MAQELKPFIAKTTNVPEFIKKVAKKFEIPPSKIDFDILNVSTGVKLPGKSTYTPLSPKLKEKLNEDAFLKSGKIDIKQSYEINIRYRHAKEPINLVLEMVIDRFHSKATAVVKKESQMERSGPIFENLVEEVNKKKVRQGMLINIRDGGMREALQECASQIVAGGKLTNDVKVPIATWVTPIPTSNDKLIFHYNKKSTEDKNMAHIDYADRGFVQEVSEGELVVEYQEPVPGTPGRTFKGLHLPVSRPKFVYKKALKADPKTIKIEKSEHGVKFYAKKDGFVSIAKRVLRIGEDLEVSSINLKETGHIVTDLDKNITITTHGSEEEDDIGTNMKVETTNINIGGGIASGAEVKAEKVVVGGSTHATSKIICKEAQINNLRGYLQCKTAKINKIEGGDVYAEKVKVGIMAGGKIHGDHIDINEFGSNITLFAKNSVRIRNTEGGGENTIVIDPGATKEDRIKIRLISNELSEMQAKRKYLFGKYQALNAVIKRNKPAFEEIKARIMQDRAKGHTTQKIFLDKYKSYQVELKKGKKLREQVQDLDLKINSKSKQVNKYQGEVLNAVIYNEDTWKDYNKIIFRTLSPPKEYVFLPPENDYAREIRLRRKDEENEEEGYEVYVVGRDDKK